MTSLSEKTPALELEGLTKQFGKTRAVDNLSLRVERGSTFGLLGPNGAGKSTTIRMLLGMLPATSGEARVLGLDVKKDSLEIKERVGYVPETHHIYRWMRVGQVIGFCRAQYANWNDEVCREMLRRFELDPEKKVKQLSKGTVVKLALVLAMSHEPELLVLDEPVAGLDPLVREELLDGVLRTICDRGQTVLISSHMLDDVQRLADTVGILYQGRLVVQGRVDELLESTKRIRATLRNGQRPTGLPEGTIHDQVEGREWLLTVREFSPEKVQQVRGLEGVEHVDVVDLGLEELFKDIVKGQRASR